MATMTPTESIELWLQDVAARDRAAGTIRRYRSAVRNFVTWYEQEEQRLLVLTQLTPITIVGYRNYLQHTQACATSTINGHLSALRAWCAWLSKQRHVHEDPAARIKLVGRQGEIAPQGLEDREINALLREAQRSRHPKRDYALLQLMLQTGMRISECAGLTMADLSMGERSGSATIRAGKGNKARVVPLNGSARQALAEYVADLLGVEQTIKAVAAAWPRSQRGTRGSPLWRSQKGGPLTTSAIRQMVDLLVRACAVRGSVPPETSAHTLRHTFAMNYLKDNPGDLLGLATLLGHASLDTTRIYGQPTAEQLASRVDRLKLNAYQA